MVNLLKVKLKGLKIELCLLAEQAGILLNSEKQIQVTEALATAEEDRNSNPEVQLVINNARETQKQCLD